MSASFSDVPELQRIVVRDNIELRPLRVEDTPRILDILESDPTIRELVSVASRIKSENDVKNEIAAMKKDNDFFRYSILRNGRYIGLMCFWRLGDFMTSLGKVAAVEPDTYGFGYFLDPAERGQGIAADALESVMNTAQQTLSPKKFIAFCTDHNKASQSILKRCGFTPTDEVVYFPDEGWYERKYIRNAGPKISE